MYSSLRLSSTRTRLFSAGFIGVGIGGDRSSGYDLAKEQLFRSVEDVNPNEDLRKLEEYIMENANKLGIGTMGFGGETTLLGCKIGVMNRIPASFFVSVAYNCWAFRRLGVTIDPVQVTLMNGCTKMEKKLILHTNKKQKKKQQPSERNGECGGITSTNYGRTNSPIKSWRCCSNQWQNVHRP